MLARSIIVHLLSLFVFQANHATTPPSGDRQVPCCQSMSGVQCIEVHHPRVWQAEARRMPRGRLKTTHSVRSQACHMLANTAAAQGSQHKLPTASRSSQQRAGTPDQKSQRTERCSASQMAGMPLVQVCILVDDLWLGSTIDTEKERSVRPTNTRANRQEGRQQAGQ